MTWFRPDRGAEITGNALLGSDVSLSGNGRQNFFIPEIGYVKQLSPSLGVGLAVYGNGGLNTSYKSGVPLYGTASGFGGGEANLHMSQNALGIAYGIPF